jgi:hypothetical protein
MESNKRPTASDFAVMTIPFPLAYTLRNINGHRSIQSSQTTNKHAETHMVLYVYLLSKAMNMLKGYENCFCLTKICIFVTQKASLANKYR